MVVTHLSLLLFFRLLYILRAVSMLLLLLLSQAGLVRDTLADIQIGDGDSDIIDHALFARPSVHGLLHEEVYGALGVPLLVKAVHDDHHYLMVAEAVPQPVRAHHENLVIRAKVREVGNFRLGSDANTGCGHITNRACHGESGDLFVLKPDALRPIEHTCLCPQARHCHTWLQA